MATSSKVILACLWQIILLDFSKKILLLPGNMPYASCPLGQQLNKLKAAAAGFRAVPNFALNP